MDKKEEKSLWEQYQLHVALIKHSEEVSSAKASFKAWLEGRDGVAQRLGQQSLLPFPDQPSTSEKQAPDAVQAFKRAVSS